MAALFQHAAMGTVFELLFDAEYEAARPFAQAACEELDRLDRKLSFYRPESEVSRMNREAGRGPVRVDAETSEILFLCNVFHRETGGFFDPVATGRGETDASARWADVAFDPDRRMVQFRTPGVRLDLGGFAKGFALDRLAADLAAAGGPPALLHGGTSSILARGGPWPVGLPFEASSASVLLSDRALGCSVLDPADAGEYPLAAGLTGPAGSPSSRRACVVLADSAVEAECLSTALLCMGRERARGYTERRGPGVHVGWAEGAGFGWLGATP